MGYDSANLHQYEVRKTEKKTSSNKITCLFCSITVIIFLVVFIIAAATMGKITGYTLSEELKTSKTLEINS